MITDRALEETAQEACISIGIDYKDVPSDGNFHPANITNDVRGKGDARLKLFPDRQGGIAWNHKSGERKLFFINTKTGVSISNAERAKIKAEQQQRKKELIARQDQAAKRALAIWDNAKPAPNSHRYLQKKHIKPYLTRVTAWTRTIRTDIGERQKLTIENSLIVPLFNESGTLRNTQAIFPADSPELGRGKDFLPYAELSGLFWWIGNKTKTVCVAEGFATAGTIHDETGWRVYISFTAGNLLSVGQIIRKHLPTSKIIFCADNDENTKGNPGITKATEAAAAVGGFVASPPLAGDFNDYHNYLQEAK